MSGLNFPAVSSPDPRRPHPPLQAAREILSAPKVFVKGSDYKNKFGFVFGDGLVTSDSEKHKGESARRWGGWRAA